MKIIFLISLLVISSACKLNMQKKGVEMIQTLPSFTILMLDGNTILHSESFPADTPTIFLYFKTDCLLCKQETKMLLEHIGSLQNVKFYLLTYMPIGTIKKFNEDFNLSSFKNIIVGNDHNFSFAKLFKPSVVPFMAIYSSDKRLVKIYNGEATFQMISEALKM